MEPTPLRDLRISRLPSQRELAKTHVVFDIQGWYGVPAGGSRYNPVDPQRILDTRSAPFGPIGDISGKFGLGTANTQTISAQVRGVGGVPASAATAVIVNTTVTEPTKPSHLIVYPSEISPVPNAANLNFVAGQTVPNLVIVKVGADGKVKLFNNEGHTHVVFDVAGYFVP